MEELCVVTREGGFCWCYGEEEYQKHLANGAKPITFLEYLEGTKKEAEEELQDLISIENCAKWYEAIDSAKDWTGFANFDDLVSFLNGNETAEDKQGEIDLAITKLDDLLDMLQAYKKTMEEASDRLGFIQNRDNDIEEEREGEKE